MTLGDAELGARGQPQSKKTNATGVCLHEVPAADRLTELEREKVVSRDWRRKSGALPSSTLGGFSLQRHRGGGDTIQGI